MKVKMRRRLAGWINPKMCSADRGAVMRHRSADTMSGSTVVDGTTYEVRKACGKKPGHKGEHGPWGRWYRLRNTVSNWLDW